MNSGTLNPVNESLTMIQLPSKLKREVKRIARNALSAPGAFFDRFFSTLYYDAVLARRVRRFDGELALGEKVAVFLIYPQDGLSVGHIQSLKYFVSEGYSPIVVSNRSLSDRDLGLLVPLCNAVMVRPNFGYDFGGYRDGVRAIASLRHKIKYLALFNDSVWFPLPGSESWLSAAERMRVDFAGALAHAGPDWREAIKFAFGAEKEKLKYKRLFHYCSFALLFSQNALASSDFWKFWDRLPISSSKSRTVKYGERGLSKFMLSGRFSHAVKITNDDIAYRLRQIPPCCRSREVSMFEDRGGWPAYSLSEFLWREYKFMFLKKKDVSGVPISIKGLDATLRILSLPATGDQSYVGGDKFIRIVKDNFGKSSS